MLLAEMLLQDETMVSRINTSKTYTITELRLVEIWWESFGRQNSRKQDEENNGETIFYLHSYCLFKLQLTELHN